MVLLLKCIENQEERNCQKSGINKSSHNRITWIYNRFQVLNAFDKYLLGKN